MTTRTRGYNTRLGAGPAIYIADAGTLSDPRLVRHLAQTGEALGIPYQFRQPGGGGTDAGAIHRVRAGIPSLSRLGAGPLRPHRAMVSRLSDWENTLALVYTALSRAWIARSAEHRIADLRLRLRPREP